MDPEPKIDPSLLRAALREIQRRGDRWIGREHLLIAAAVAYEPSMLDADALRAATDTVLGPTPELPGGPSGPPVGYLPTDRTAHALARSCALAASRGRATAGAAQVLAALLDRTDDSSRLAEAILAAAGIDADAIRARLDADERER